MSADERHDAIVVGGGVAGLSAATFTARHGLDTAVLSAGSSLLARNAHLENYPGFPAGIDARVLLDLLETQVERAGGELVEADVTAVAPPDSDEAEHAFVVETAAGARRTADYVVAATKNRVDYLDDVDGVGVVERGKTFVDTDERGRTGVDGLYAAGRLAEKSHQAIVAAGHGAEVAVTLLEEHDAGFYHDWVAPEGYFTGRDRDVPPGCEEVDDDERRQRAQASLDVLREHLTEANLSEPEQHPDVE